MINPFKSKKGLGRGLSSLIGDSDVKTSNTKKVISIANTIRSTIKFISLPNITCEVIKNVTKDKIKMGIY